MSAPPKVGGPPAHRKAAVRVQHILQWGRPRTATTLQFQMLCIIKFMLHRGRKDHVSCPYLDNDVTNYSLPLPEPGRFRVFKTHGTMRTGSLPPIPAGASPDDLWLFATAAEKDAGGMKADLARVPALARDLERQLGWPVKYVQTTYSLGKHGYREFAASYQRIFGLSDEELYELTTNQRGLAVERHREVCGV